MWRGVAAGLNSQTKRASEFKHDHPQQKQATKSKSTSRRALQQWGRRLVERYFFDRMNECFLFLIFFFFGIKVVCATAFQLAGGAGERERVSSRTNRQTRRHADTHTHTHTHTDQGGADTLTQPRRRRTSTNTNFQSGRVTNLPWPLLFGFEPTVGVGSKLINRVNVLRFVDVVVLLGTIYPFRAATYNVL